MSKFGTLAAAAAIASLMPMAGCQTASLEDAAPKSVPSNVQARQSTKTATDSDARIISPIPLSGGQIETVQRQQFVEERIAQDGRYPVVGLDREAAMAQMSPAQAQALKREFSQYRGGAKARGTTDAEYRRRLAELRQTAQTHAQDAESEIEN